MLFTKKLRSDNHEAFCREYAVQGVNDFNFAFDVLDRKAHLTPDALCICHVDDSFTRRDHTCRDMARASARVASALKNLGIRKGDKVLLMLHRRVEWWQTMLGLHKLGAVAIPSPAQLTPHDVEMRCRQTEARANNADHLLCRGIETIRQSLPDLEFCIQVGFEDPETGAMSPLPSKL